MLGRVVELESIWRAQPYPPVGQRWMTPLSVGTTEDDVQEALQKLDPLWDELFPAEKERIVKLLVQEVVVGQDSLLIRRGCTA